MRERTLFLTALIVFSLLFILPTVPKAYALENTFGTTSVGASDISTGGAGKVWALYALSEDGTVSKIVFYTNNAGHLRGALYSDNAGNPDTLLASSAEVDGGSGWNNLTLTTPYEASAGNYWLFTTWDYSTNWYFTESSGTDAWNYDYNVPSPAGSHIDRTDLVSIYAVYTPSGGPTEYTADLTLGWTQAISAGTHWVANTAETLEFTTALAGTVISAFNILGTATWSLGLDGAYQWVANVPASLSIISAINVGVSSVFNVAESIGFSLGLDVDALLTPLVTFVVDLTLGWTTGITSAYSWVANANPVLSWILYLNALAVHVATGGGIEGLNFILAIVGISLAVVALISFTKDR